MVKTTLNRNTKAILLSDIDGVVTDWFSGYASYMASINKPHNGNHPARFDMTDVFPDIDKPWAHIMDYQHSNFYHSMPFFDDISDTLTLLKSIGVDVRFVTSCGDTDTIMIARDAYLDRNFKNLYSHVHYLPMGANKSSLFTQYTQLDIPVMVIDDQESILQSAQLFGFIPILKDMKYNQYTDSGYQRVSEYSELLDIAKQLIEEHDVNQEKPKVA